MFNRFVFWTKKFRLRDGLEFLFISQTCSVQHLIIYNGALLLSNKLSCIKRKRKQNETLCSRAKLGSGTLWEVSLLGIIRFMHDRRISLKKSNWLKKMLPAWPECSTMGSAHQCVLNLLTQQTQHTLWSPKYVTSAFRRCHDSHRNPWAFQYD